MVISIHAPARGGDADLSIQVTVYDVFQSTPPRGGATTIEHIFPLAWQFQSTPPRGGATLQPADKPR